MKKKNNLNTIRKYRSIHIQKYKIIKEIKARHVKSLIQHCTQYKSTREIILIN